MCKKRYAPMAQQGSIYSLSTPAVLIDETIVDKNIMRVQNYMDQAGLKARPHIKTHKIPEFAKKQLAAGAIGITCQKISEAQIFADAGITDILLTFNIMGAEKLDSLKALHEQITLSVVADSRETVDGLAATMDEKHPLRVMVECDTGGQRCGVQTPREARDLAQYIADKPSLTFIGLMTYPMPNAEDDVEAFFEQTAGLLKEAGLECEVFSTGGSPSLFSAERATIANEYRAGTYIYNDRSLVRAGHCGFDDCAMHILTTVVSRPTQDRAVLDAGSKALTSDLLGFADFGYVVDYPEAVITGLSEEHAVVDLSACSKKPKIGEKIRIIPNHTCVVSSLMSHIYVHKSGVFDRKLDVAARGKVW
ncbi:D-TA family PLP-dependent enzyme [uncultured Maritalea sp.]|uniref:D-TA family PLP-dependent enzyme n=1 Tax=uncultured Maritalea sp. TaxID=757249 RepID=UPI00261FA054|nr:D-TA family PLP-dependent enzyme [uncultured Maritalea sp.]